MQKLFSKENDRWTLPLLCLLLSVLGFTLYGGYLMKVAGVFAGAWLVWLFATSDLRALRTPFAWPLAGYVAFAMLTAIWAMSGKFFLREYLKIFLGAAICFTLLLKHRFGGDTVRRTMSLIAGTSAVYALLGTEGATTGFTKLVFAALAPNSLDETGCAWIASRLYGIFGNPNLEAGIYAIGVILSLALLCRAAEKRERIAYAAALSFNAFALLMGFSMGALVCFAVAIVLYLVFAGENRMAALVRMLEAAVPTLVSAMFSYMLFTRGEAAAKAVLLVMLLNAAVTVALELFAAPRLIAVLETNSRAAICFLLGIAAAAALYVVLAFSIHGAYTFGAPIARPISLTPGEHTLLVDADGEVNVLIQSVNRVSLFTGRNREAYYSGADTQAAFVVPDDSEVMWITLYAGEGVTLSAFTIDGAVELPLAYPLLPGFAAERIQGIRVNTSAIQRVEFMKDALKLWRLSPVVGSGLGAFECGYPRVQEFPYQTRYVHSHYYQTLTECGVIGLALWLAAIAAMAAALWRKRKDTDSPYRWCYAALWAALVMLALHSAWDAALSFLIVLLYAYTLFGLILRICAAEPAEAAAEQPKKRKKSRAPQKREVSLDRVAAVLFPAVFTLTLCGNLWSQQLLAKAMQSETYDQFFARTDLAMRLDAYEYNDAKLSYVQSAAKNRTVLPESILARADAYAAELSKVQSNSVPQALTAYYIMMGEYEKAIGAAKLAAVYSAANGTVWNETANLLRETLSANYYAPLLSDAEPLVRELLAYRALLDAHNEAAIERVELSPENEDFFTRVARLVPYPDDPADVFMLLSAE